jgi:hypothetical protein
MEELLRFYRRRVRYETRLPFRNSAFNHQRAAQATVPNCTGVSAIGLLILRPYAVLRFDGKLPRHRSVFGLLAGFSGFHFIGHARSLPLPIGCDIANNRIIFPI